MTRGTSSVALWLLVLMNPTHGADQIAPPTIVTFDQEEVGRPPVGFTTALTGGGSPVSWVIQQDPTAPSGGKVLAQTSADNTGARFPLCIYDAISVADSSLSVKFKPLSGTVDQAAGIVWRYEGPANYYLVRANALEGNVVPYKVENGKRSDLKPVGSGRLFTYGKKVPVAQGRWQTLKVDVRGSHFRVFLNDEHLFDVEDTTFTAAGKVGLWTKADSVTAFDDFTISAVTAGAPSGTPSRAP